MTDLPSDVIDEAERLTRLAREAIDDNEAAAYRRERDDLLAEYGYTARIRAEDDTLVCHPEEWVDDEGTIHPEEIEDIDRGVERSLSGPGEGDDWEAIEAHNRAIAEAVADEHGEPHGETAHALADFAGNHYAKPIDDLTEGELAEFREEYLPRNGWPSDAQLETLGLSIEYTLEKADAERLD
ncbi:MAG: DUF7108 domain-containing protein [Halovenus sp.]